MTCVSVRWVSECSIQEFLKIKNRRKQINLKHGDTNGADCWHIHIWIFWACSGEQQECIIAYYYFDVEDEVNELLKVIKSKIWGDGSA